MSEIPTVPRDLDKSGLNYQMIFIVVFVIIILLLCLSLNNVSVSYVTTIRRNELRDDPRNDVIYKNVDKTEPFVNCSRCPYCGRKHCNDRTERNRRLNQTFHPHCRHCH